MKTFDLFYHLGQANNAEAYFYRCGYYIINKYCNKNVHIKTKDTFYTIFDNMLLKFNMMESGDNQFFNVYKLRDLTDEQIIKLSCFTADLEDLDSDWIETAMNIENIDVM